jgi:hypothetical protein
MILAVIPYPMLSEIETAANEVCQEAIRDLQEFRKREGGKA